MRWPWQSKTKGDRLVVSWAGKEFAFVRAGFNGEHWELYQMGIEAMGNDDARTFADRIARLGLKGSEVHAMLRSDQFQFLQVEAPAVPPEEQRAATRYLVRDMIDSHLDDVTLDILKVGDGEHKAAGQLFAIVVPNKAIRDIMELARALQWKVPVIDIQKMAQRNLQSALAALDGLQDRAVAAVVVGARHASLTICAKGELFYTRRIDLPEGFDRIDWAAIQSVTHDSESYLPVGEYVPDYAGASPYNTVSEPAPVAAGAAAQDDNDKAQRFLVEVQRSLDLWDRTWTAMPLAGISVFADENTPSLAQWLARELGQNVKPMEMARVFPGFAKAAPDVQRACAPLLGILLRDDSVV